MKFAGKIVAITGAAGGIGQELCRIFGNAGAIIYALDKKDSVIALAGVLAKEGIEVHALVLDIGDLAAVEVKFGNMIKEFGAVDVMINNAGFSDHQTIERTTPADWAHDINGNLNGAYNCTFAVLPEMKLKCRGVIVTVGSVNGLSALGDPAYSASKAGLISMTKALAMEYGRYGVRANIVLAGTVRTPIWDERARKDPSILKTLMRWYPLGRIAEPSEVAKAVAFLASDDASAVTGSELLVDCGLTAGNIVMSRELTLEDF